MNDNSIIISLLKGIKYGIDCLLTSFSGEEVLKQLIEAPMVDTNNLDGQETFPIIDNGTIYNLSLGTFAQLVGGGGGGVPSHSIAEHNNVVGNPQNGDVLTYNNGNWQPSAPNNGGGVSQLNDLIDVDTSGGSQGGDTLIFDSNDNNWKPGVISYVASHPISQHSDFSGNPQANDILTYNGFNWEPQPNAGKSHTLTEHSDVTGVPYANQILQYDGNNWVPTILSGWWGLTGNALTDPNSNFIGTTDDVDIKIRRGNALHGVISNKRVALGNLACFSEENSSNYNYTIALGNSSMYNNSTGVFNIAIGADALFSNETGQNNIAIGTSTLYSSTASYNTAIGDSALLDTVGGNNNTAIGHGSGRHNVSGNYNTFIGQLAGHKLNDNVTNNTTNSYQIAIGYNATSNGSNTAVIGSGAITNTRIYGSLLLGTNTPESSALLAMDSFNQGFLPPRMSAISAEAIASPAEGLMVYSTDGSGVTITTKGWWGFDGTNWVKLN